jgi:RES domain-containing protein
VRIYRLAKAQYDAALLTGQGGLLADGRWHTAGRPVVYAASSEALAVLEVRVHLRRPLPAVAFTMHAIDVPDSLIEELSPAELPADWHAVPPRGASQAVGDRWLAAARSLALRVPSIHSASDANLLINPLHRAAGRIVVAGSRAYAFDPRLFAV